MKDYVKLQFLMMNRKLSDFGVHPIIGYILLLFVFIALTAYLFYKTTYAPYIYVLIALYFTSKLSENRRNDFLKICFGSKHRQIRIMENLIILLPFAIYLIYRQHFTPFFILAAITVLMALLNFNTTYHVTIPTPFYKKPFEFTVGFRNTFFLFIISYGLTIIALAVDNFNLGIFALTLVFFTVISYYMKPENEYFVWSYSCTPAKFLIEKIRTAFLFTFYLCLPVLLLLSLFFWENIHILLVFTLIGYLYLTMIILTKYAAYPNEMDIIQGIIVGLTFVLPPLLIAIIPFFAIQSINKLKAFLR